MKKGLLFIVLFVAWCILGAIWYMFWIKGIADDPLHFQPHPTFQAIIEILLLLLGAFLLGFGVAWRVKSDSEEKLKDEVRNLKYDVSDLQRETAEQGRLRDQAHAKATEAREQVDSLQAAVDEQTRASNTYKSQANEAKEKLKALEVAHASADGELNAAKFRVKLLENDVAEKQATIGKLIVELEQAAQQPMHRDWSDHPFVRPVEADSDEKDDLTEIKGIGPSFQKKLNSFDIYTFRQLSELSGESVQRLAEVIEVFPDRIHRDNWVGQATRLYLKKTGREA